MNCPYCTNSLGDLDPIMVELSKEPFSGILDFTSQCCGKRIRAFSKTAMFYIVKAEELSECEDNKPIMIGAL